MFTTFRELLFADHYEIHRIHLSYRWLYHKKKKTTKTDNNLERIMFLKRNSYLEI